MRAHAIKKDSQPIIFARYPVGADIITRGMAIRLLSSAYWVAVNLLSVMEAIKARKAAVPAAPIVLRAVLLVNEFFLFISDQHPLK